VAELSLCMIVRNEEKNLKKCLESVKDAVDEIVIVDTGSTDYTREIAKGYTDKVYDYMWQDDFAHARNTSFSHASKPFLLWLDADDMLEPQERQKLIKLKTELSDQVDAVMMPYHYAFEPDGRPALVFERERIVRRDAGFLFEGRVHEAIAVSGHVIHADIAIRHTGKHGRESNQRNLRIYERWKESGQKMTPRDLYYYARELKNAGEYVKAEKIFTQFLMQDGWKENRLDAFVQRSECLNILGRRKKAKKSCLQAFLEAPPRAEALCQLGALFMQEERWEEASFWYRSALLSKMPRESGAFVCADAYGYTPLIQLCVCCDRLGLHEEASRMNEQALLMRPQDPAALQNRAYFSRILKRTCESRKIQTEEA